MSDPRPAEPLRRVLLALDAAIEQRAIESGLELARLLAREVHGLFVEDERMLQVAALPFTRRLITGGGHLPLEAEDVESEWRASAARAEARLRTGAKVRELGWTFSVTRGRLTRTLVERGSEETVIVAHSSDPRRGPVRVVEGPDPENGGPRDVAERLAGGRADVESVASPEGDVEAIRRLVETRPGGVLVLRRSHPLAEALLRGERLPQLPCAVVIVR